jgi:hypothetical protein
MIDEIVETAASVYVGEQLDRAAKKHHWARILRAGIAFVSFALLIALIYIVVRYS